MNAPLFLSVVAIGAMLPCAFSQEAVQAAPQVEMKPTKVSLFKNGFAFLSFEGKMPKSQRVELTNLPIPCFGSFWLNISLPAKIAKISSERVKAKVPIYSSDFYELAKANEGEKVSVLLYSDEGGNALSGVIQSVSEQASSDNPNLIGSEAIVPTERERMIVLQSEDQYIFLKASLIKTMTFLGKEPRKVQQQVERTKLFADVNNPAEGTLFASSLAKGISWVPEYKIDLGDDGKAYFSAQALIINYLMDFDNVEMNLVSGYPSLMFSNVFSPLSGRYKTLDEFLVNLDSGGLAGGIKVPASLFQMSRNSFAAQSIGGNSFMGSARSSESQLSSYGNPAEIVKAEDLFFYPVGGVSCKYGSSSLFPLFGGEVSYKHVYTLDIPNQMQLQVWDQLTERGSPSPEDTSRDIWHCIRFTNSFSLPLTKGVMEFTTKGNLVGQGFVEFTSPGQEATVRVNKTMQVGLKREEKTISTESRKLGDGHTYTVSTVEGSLTMKNYSSKPMEMEVTKHVTGTPISASEGGKFSFVPGGDWRNPQGKFKWMTELPPGESKTLTYQYTYATN